MSTAPNPTKYQSFNVTDEGVAVVGFTKVELGTVTRKTLAELSPVQLMTLHNANAEQTLTRFASKEAGVEKTWAALCNNCSIQLDSHKPVTTMLDHEPKAGVAPKTAKEVKSKEPKEPKAPKPPKEPAPKKGMNLPQQAVVKALREGTNQYKVAVLLVRPGGAVMSELQAAIGATVHNPIAPETSIRAVLNWDLNKVKGYGVRSSYDEADVEHFRIEFVAPVTELLVVTKEAAETAQQSAAKAATAAKKAKADAAKAAKAEPTPEPEPEPEVTESDEPEPTPEPEAKAIKAKNKGKSHGAVK